MAVVYFFAVIFRTFLQHGGALVDSSVFWIFVGLFCWKRNCL